MKEINLTQGKVTLVDDDDFAGLNCFKWCAHKKKKTYYAVRKSILIAGKRKIIRMHCGIMGKLQGLQIDHIDGNGLNNQKSNLRFVTSRQNSQNLKNVIKASQYPGVSWHKRDRKWQTSIYIKGKAKHLGYFANETDAFEIYRKAVNNIGETVVGGQ